MKSIDQIVKEIRHKAKLTQEEFARLIGISRSAIANYETGRCVPPGDILLKIIEFGKRQQ